MADKRNVKEFLGRGIGFPLSVEMGTGRIKMVSYEEDIEESIKLILMTEKGERVMQPYFGCKLRQFSFGSINRAMLSHIEKEVKESLVLWEPRIIEVEVKVTEDYAQQEGKIIINIHYLVRATNNPYNLVYPYYINEGLQ